MQSQSIARDGPQTKQTNKQNQGSLWGEIQQLCSQPQPNSPVVLREQNPRMVLSLQEPKVLSCLFKSMDNICIKAWQCPSTQGLENNQHEAACGYLRGHGSSGLCIQPSLPLRFCALGSTCHLVWVLKPLTGTANTTQSSTIHSHCLRISASLMAISSDHPSGTMGPFSMHDRRDSEKNRHFTRAPWCMG